jgi:predicted  nucleic acid-binding Zn-ribbon protein
MQGDNLAKELNRLHEEIAAKEQRAIDEEKAISQLEKALIEARKDEAALQGFHERISQEETLLQAMEASVKEELPEKRIRGLVDLVCTINSCEDAFAKMFDPNES